ncbi:DUF4225 domain-containing protein [Pantoea sp. B65]|uniref:DUF4225 domain-containing protein n=1 Tax=Pantoea sp. B65 TaxID=2813359 RepID=UPI0039B5FDBA
MFSLNKNKEAFEARISELRRLVHDLSIKYLRYNSSEFYFDVEQLINEIQQQIVIHCQSYRWGIEQLQKEIDELHQQDMALTTDRLKLYLIVERERQYKITLKQVGFVGGGAQMMAGIGVCVVSLGAACAGYGLPVLLHGANNVYENGHYLLLREERSGSVRDAWRYAAGRLGYGHDDADMAYAAVDLALTAYGATQKILLSREKSWKLFRHIHSDYIHGWQAMGKPALPAEVAGFLNTNISIYKIKAGEE